MDGIVILVCVCMFLSFISIAIGLYIVTKLNILSAKIDANCDQIRNLKCEFNSYTEAFCKAHEEHLDITNRLVDHLADYIRREKNSKDELLGLSYQIKESVNTCEKRYSDIYEQFDLCRTMLNSIENTLNEICTPEEEAENGYEDPTDPRYYSDLFAITGDKADST